MSKQKKPAVVSSLPDHLKPREDEIKEFLELFHPNGPWSVNAVRASIERAKMVGGTFPKIEDCVARVIERNSERDNVWFSIGRFDANTKGGKAKKSDILSIPALWIDLDVDKSLEGDERDKAMADQVRRLTVDLPPGVPRPSLIVNSGNGHWAYWLLQDSFDNPFGPIEQINKWVLEVEERNYWLAEQFGADRCHNIDRIARIPGTINWPTKTKIEAGFEPVMAKYLREKSDPNLAYDLGEFQRLELPNKKGSANAGTDKAGSTDRSPITERQLEMKVGKTTTARVVNGRVDDDPNDRSKVLWKVVFSLVSRNLDDAQVRYVLLNKDWRISDHIYDQPNPMRYVNRQITRAKARMSNTFVASAKSGWRPLSSSPHNCRVALNRLGITFEKDLFTDEILVDGLEDDFDGRVLDEVMFNWLIDRFGTEFDFDASETKLKSTIEAIAHENRYDSLSIYLNNLTWDRVERADRMFIDYAKVEDTPVNAEITRCFLLSAVGRAFVPGFKSDETIVIEGKQGSYKSTLCSELPPFPEMFSDNLSWKYDSKEIIEISRGKWIMENGELDGVHSADLPKMKAVMARTVDESRLAYAKMVSKLPRRWVPIATTNENAYLLDQTGNRRFRPMRMREGEKCDLAGWIEVRDQVWAEIVHRWKAGERPVFKQELKADLQSATELREIEEPIKERLTSVLGLPGEGLDGKIRNGTVAEIALGRPETPNGHVGKRIKAAMAELGFEPVNVKFKGVEYSSRGYRRGDEKASELFVVLNDLGRIIGVSEKHGEVVNTTANEQL